MDAKLPDCVSNNLRGVGPVKLRDFSTRGLLALAKGMDRALAQERRGNAAEPAVPVPTAPMTDDEVKDMAVAEHTFVGPATGADGAELTAAEREAALRDGLIRQVLDAKNARAKLKKDAAKAIDNVGEQALDSIEEQLAAMKVAASDEAPSGQPPPPPTEAREDEDDDDEDAIRELPSRKPRTGVRVASFNSCKLKEQTLGMHDQFLAFTAMLAQSFDVIVLQEVPAGGDADAQLTRLAKIFEEHTPRFDVFQYAVSEASGPATSASEGKNAKYKERHAIFVRAPLRILAHREIEELDGARFDYRPLAVLIQMDEEAADILGTDRMVVTSIHMPPSSRKKARDQQLRALLKHYPLNADARVDEAFSIRAHREARRKGEKAVHLLCGDFNCHPGATDKDGTEVYDLRAAGWARPLIGDEIPTSASGRTLDNFVMDSEAEAKLHNRAVVTAEVLSVDFLRRPATEKHEGQKGISDHLPIGLAIKKPLAPPPRGEATEGGGGDGVLV